MTMIEMFGDKFVDKFRNIDNFNIMGYGSEDDMILNNINNHMNLYMIPYQREININNILNEENDGGIQNT